MFSNLTKIYEKGLSGELLLKMFSEKSFWGGIEIFFLRGGLGELTLDDSK